MKRIDLFGDFQPVKINSSMKFPLILVLDVSGSMTQRTPYGRKTKISELNEKVKMLLEFVQADPKASQITDLAIVTFGGEVSVQAPFDNVKSISFKPLRAYSSTPMGSAVNVALDMINARKKYYLDNGVEFYRPRIFLMSDGAATDQYEQAAKRCSTMVNNREVKMYPIWIGEGEYDYILKDFSPELEPKTIKSDQMYFEMFRSLSGSTSNPDDDPFDRWFKDEF
jgi:uncharacterized protein YegL